LVPIQVLFFLKCSFYFFFLKKGYNDPPQFGDYEAQRHWMELTINTPTSEWYIATKNNNLTYWRIDYPPLTAFHSELLGFFSQLYEPKSMEIIKSHGYETKTHKFFMRLSVLVSDLLVFILGVVLFVNLDRKKFNIAMKYGVILFVLCSPPFILIDHGHFQYNCVALGKPSIL
jgi:alpha-1,3-glucosyltransferase